MYYFSIFISSLALIFISNKIFNYFEIGIENTSLVSRKIHSVRVNRLGGIVFFIMLATYPLTENTLLQSSIIFALMIAIVGFVEDIYKKISNYIRLFLIFSITVAFVLLYNINIISFDNQILESIINRNYYISFIFVTLSIIIAVNGFNFIDGLNGLVLGYSIIILIVFCFFSQNEYPIIFSVCFSLIICCTALFLFNFLGNNIYTGDGGSYFLGFLISILCITICNNNILQASEIAFLISYPIIEVIFSFLRRIISQKRGSLEPDNLHLHQLVFFNILILFKNLNLNFSRNYLNSLSSILLLFVISIIIISGLSINHLINSLYLLLFFIILYCTTYYFLHKSFLKNS